MATYYCLFCLYMISATVLIRYHLSLKAFMELNKIRIDSKEDLLLAIVVFMPVINTLVMITALSIHFGIEVRCFLAKRRADIDCWIIRRHAEVEARIIKQYGADWFINKRQKDIEELKKAYKSQVDSTLKDSIKNYN